MCNANAWQHRSDHFPLEFSFKLIPGARTCGSEGLMWCVPVGNDAIPGAIRTRRWSEPIVLRGIDVPIAPVATVLRHLGLGDLPQPDGLCTSHRVELALEWLISAVGVAALRATESCTN